MFIDGKGLKYLHKSGDWSYEYSRVKEWREFIFTLRDLPAVVDEDNCMQDKGRKFLLWCGARKSFQCYTCSSKLSLVPSPPPQLLITCRLALSIAIWYLRCATVRAWSWWSWSAPTPSLRSPSASVTSRGQRWWDHYCAHSQVVTFTTSSPVFTESPLLVC